MVLYIAILGLALIVPINFHLSNIKKIKEIIQKTGGVIRSKQDLLLVKEAINLSMMLAVFYIVFFILLVIIHRPKTRIDSSIYLKK